MKDRAPYLNPYNGERTSFPHGVSVYAPRDTCTCGVAWGTAEGPCVCEPADNQTIEGAS